MIIRVKGASPADEIGFLTRPVGLSVDGNRGVHADILQILGRDIGDIHTHLVAFCYVDFKGQAGSVLLIDAVAAFFPSGGL